MISPPQQGSSLHLLKRTAAGRSTRDNVRQKVFFLSQEKLVGSLRFEKKKKKKEKKLALLSSHDTSVTTNVEK